MNKNIPLKKIKKTLKKPVTQLRFEYDKRQYKKWIKQSSNVPVVQLNERPLISIIVPTYNTPLNYFEEMINSVISQSYDNWQLIVVDDASKTQNLRDLIEQYAQINSKIIYKFLDENHHISGATNEGIKLARGEFIGLLDHDDILHPEALYEIAKAININDKLDFIYTDEDKIVEESSVLKDPFFKPDWNQDFMYSVNYITHFTVIRKKLLDKIGYEDGGYNGAQDWELFLRTTRSTTPELIKHIPKILYSWRVHDASTAKSTDSKPYVIESQKKAIESDLIARNFSDFILSQDKKYPGQWELQFNYRKNEKVLIIIKDNVNFNQARDHILANTDYKDYEIQKLSRGHEIVHLLNLKQFSFFVFVDQELSIDNRNWLLKMLGDAQRPDIGFVLARLKYEDEVMKNVLPIINNDAGDFVYKMKKRVITKHLYMTARYNIKGIESGGVVIVEAKKLLSLNLDKKSNARDLLSISKELIKDGYRNLYNPYIDVIR